MVKDLTSRETSGAGAAIHDKPAAMENPVDCVLHNKEKEEEEEGGGGRGGEEEEEEEEEEEGKRGKSTEPAAIAAVAAGVAAVGGERQRLPDEKEEVRRWPPPLLLLPLQRMEAARAPAPLDKPELFRPPARNSMLIWQYLPSAKSWRRGWRRSSLVDKEEPVVEQPS